MNQDKIDETVTRLKHEVFLDEKSLDGYGLEELEKMAVERGVGIEETRKTWEIIGLDTTLLDDPEGRTRELKKSISKWHRRMQFIDFQLDHGF